MQSITPFLWFDNQAEEAAKFYVSIFKNSKMGTMGRYGEGGPGEPGSVMVAAALLEKKKIDIAALRRAHEGSAAPAR